MKSLLTALSELFLSVNEYVNRSDKNSTVNEWNDVFAQGVNKDFVEMWMYICNYHQNKSTELVIVDLPFLQSFGKITNCLDYTYLFQHPDPKIPKWSKLLTQSCMLLTHPVNTLQLWGYHMLRTLIPGLVEVDLAAVTTNTPHEKGLVFKQFNDTLRNVQDIVQSILIEFK